MSIFISSTPTIEENDLRLCKKLLKEDEVEDLDIKLPGFDDRKHFYTNMGRSSLYLILKALGIGSGDEVIIQSFTCMALVVPILWVKAKPIYADINIDTYNMSFDSLKKRVTENTKAIIIQHTFGISSQVEKIKEHINELNRDRENNKIYLIEDCAHSLNIKKGNNYLGSLGDASFFSFGQDKVLSTTQGGCIIANSKELEEKIEKEYKEVPDMPEDIVKYNLRYPLVWNLIKKMYYKPSFLANSNKLSKYTIGKFLILLFRVLGLIKQQASSTDFGNPKEDIFKLSDKQKHLLKNQLDKIGRLSDHRADISKKYSRILDLDLQGSLIRYPILVDNPTTVKKELQKSKVIAGNWYNYPVIPRGIDLRKVKYHLGSCPNTEYVMEHIINLPTAIDVTKREAEIISRIVKPNIM